MTPFQNLKKNIHKIKFDCDIKYIPEYRAAFARVLDRLDKFFIENNLYSCGNYQKYIEEMIKPNSKFSFKVNPELTKRGWAGVHSRKLDGTRTIEIATEYISNGLETEGVLCHEFLHYLTLGPEKLNYTVNGEKVEVTFSLYKNQSKKSVWEKGNKTTNPDLSMKKSSVEAINGGFICEAMTELTKQKIYAKKESYHAYSPQTEMINFVSKMVDGPLSTREFLQGDLQSFASAMGHNFDVFYKKCDEFQEKFNQNANIDYKNDQTYIEIQDTFVIGYLNNIYYQIQNPKYTPSKMASIISVLRDAPVQTNKYDKLISNIKSKMADMKHLSYTQKLNFYKLFDLTVDQILLADKKAYTLPKSAPDLKIEKTETGFAINYCGSHTITSENLPSVPGRSITFINKNSKNETIDISVTLNDYGNYEIKATNRVTSASDSFNILVDANNPSNMIITDNATSKKYRINFETISKVKQRHVEESKNLLNNFEHYDAMQAIISKFPDNPIKDIKKITTNNGQQYFVATNGKQTLFVKTIGKDYALVDIQTQFVPDETKISEKISTAKNDTGMIGFMPTETKTDNDSLAFTLADGTTIVSYYDENGKLAYGEQITPFSTGEKITIKLSNINLFSYQNPTMHQIFDITTEKSTDSSFFKYEIKRTPATENHSENNNQTTQEENNNKNIQIQRRRAEEQTNEKISEQEIAERNKKLQEEQKLRAKREELQRQKFKATQKSNNTEQYDYYDTEINAKKQNIYGRSR